MRIDNHAVHLSGMIKSAIINKYWTPQSNHRHTFLSVYLIYVVVDDNLVIFLQ